MVVKVDIMVEEPTRPGVSGVSHGNRTLVTKTADEDGVQAIRFFGRKVSEVTVQAGVNGCRPLVRVLLEPENAP